MKVNVLILRSELILSDDVVYLSEYFNLFYSIDEIHDVDVIIYISDSFDDKFLEFCRDLRAKDIWLPLIVLSMGYDEIHAVACFEVGADDYVFYPLRMREFVSRISAHARRQNLKVSTVDSRIVIGNLKLYPDQYRVLKNNLSIPLTLKEFEILFFMVSRPNTIIDREEFLKVMGARKEKIRMVDIYISRLRTKLELNPDTNGKKRICIRTVTKFGYILEVKN